MSIIKRHDVVDDILKRQRNQEKINELCKGIPSWKEMKEEDRDKLIKYYQSNFIGEENLLFKCTYQFLKQTTIDTNEIFTATIGENKSLKDMRLNKTIKFSEESEMFVTLNIDLNKVYSFINLKTKWLYFKLCKVEVEFRNNSKSSFIPISCYYLPPCSDTNDFNYLFTNFLINVNVLSKMTL